MILVAMGEKEGAPITVAVLLGEGVDNHAAVLAYAPVEDTHSWDFVKGVVTPHLQQCSQKKKNAY